MRRCYACDGLSVQKQPNPNVICDFLFVLNKKKLQQNKDENDTEKSKSKECTWYVIYS